MMHGTNVKIIAAQQARLCYSYKITKLKLLKTNATVWFNELCKIKHLKPNYINIKINGKNSQDKKTTTNAIKYRINQEIKFLYCKKQILNQQLCCIHLQCAQYCNGMWQHIKNSINSQLDDIMDTLYQKLNKKLDTLIRHTHVTYNTKETIHAFHSWLVSLTNTKFTKEQIYTLTLSFIYGVEKDLKFYINDTIIDTENAIRHLDTNIQNNFDSCSGQNPQNACTVISFSEGVPESPWFRMQ
jgi:hypothetical protein